MVVRWRLRFVGVSWIGLVACGSGSPAGPGPGSQQSSIYPALKPDIGQIVDHGGTLLKSAKLVTVTWTADPNEAALEDFGDKLGASAYWKEVVGGYGIGPATSGSANHVRVKTAPPATIEDTALETWLVQQVKDPKTSGWPAWDSETVYVVYVSTKTKLTSGGADACSTYSSVHSDVAVGSIPHVAYVFIDENCNGSRSVLDGATSAASHEIAEAVTNPHPSTDIGYEGFDDAHLAWNLSYGRDEEIGDVCENLADAFFAGPPDLPYMLQRLWSNASAAAGHSPCVPQSSEPYFNVTPMAMEPLNVRVGVAQTPYKAALGYEIPVGSTKAFSVGYYSDALTGFWDIRAVEGNGVDATATKSLTISVNTNGAGVNGYTATITVKVDSAPSGGNAILMTIVSSAPGHTTHYMPILIGAY